MHASVPWQWASPTATTPLFLLMKTRGVTLPKQCKDRVGRRTQKILALCFWRPGWRPSQLVVSVIYAAALWNVDGGDLRRNWGKGQVLGPISAPRCTALT